MSSAAASEGRTRKAIWLRRMRRFTSDGSGGVAPRIVLIVSAATVICGLAGYAVAHHIDGNRQQAQRERLLTAIEQVRTVLADTTTQLAGNVASARPSDIAGKLVPSAMLRYGYANAFAADPSGKLLGAYPDGAKLPVSVARMFEASRRTASAGSTTPLTIAGDVLADASIPAFAAVATMVGDRSLAIAALMPFDASLLHRLQRMAGIESLDFSGDAAGESKVTQSLTDGRGRIVGWLTWNADRAATGALLWLMPLVTIVAASIVSFMALTFSRARSGTGGTARGTQIDPLTGAASRAHAFEILERAVAGRAPNRNVMLCFLDLHGFNEINDSFGYRGGDALLATTAQRLRDTLPQSAMIGRVGGDEFAIVVAVENDVAGVELANAALNAVSQPVELGNQTATIGACVGIAIAPRDGDSRDELVRRADLALRAAKARGPSSVVNFDLALEQEFHDRRFIIRGLRRALAEDGLDVRYQPIVAADTQRVLGVEALLRWRHRTRGEIPPEVFIPIAEQAGLMPQLGEFVLRRALADAARWKNLYIAVNVSPMQARDHGLVELVASILRQTGTPASRVVLEITEGVLIDDPDRVVKRLQRLRDLGVKIALDDFGAGYSSLRYLQRFPIDKLKIDKGFVSPLGQSESAGVIIHAIIALGRALGLNVVVEGVETEQQRVLLRVAGCDEMQGHLFAKPLQASEIDTVNLRAAAPLPARTG